MLEILGIGIPAIYIVYIVFRIVGQISDQREQKKFEQLSPEEKAKLAENIQKELVRPSRWWEKLIAIVVVGFLIILFLIFIYLLLTQ